MKTQTRTNRSTVFISLFICGIIVFWGFRAFGQEWTAEQKEVWQAVETDYESFKKGNLEKLLASRHDDFILWWDIKVLPFDKKQAQLEYKMWFDYDIPVNWVLEPLTVKVSGNLAIVAFIYEYSGNISSGRGRIMATWVKQDNKWLLLSSFSASCDKPSACPSK